LLTAGLLGNEWQACFLWALGPTIFANSTTAQEMSALCQKMFWQKYWH